MSMRPDHTDDAVCYFMGPYRNAPLTSAIMSTRLPRFVAVSLSTILIADRPGVPENISSAPFFLRNSLATKRALMTGSAAVPLFTITHRVPTLMDPAWFWHVVRGTISKVFI